jgi:L-iditol 2-dehydrogenase
MNAYKIVIPEVGKVDIREIQVGDPKPNELQVKCLANGVCMLEVAQFAGWEPIWPSTGHEGIGVVTKVGADVHGVEEGDCVACELWASLSNMPAADCPRFSAPPDDPSLYIVEPPSCVVLAAPFYEIIPGDRVLVLGAGYMGLLNVQLLGRYPLAELIVSDVKGRNLKIAKSFGATEVINSASDEGQARLQALKENPFDLVVETAGVEQTIQMAGSLTRLGGRIAAFAWHHKARTLDMGEWLVKGLKVLNTAPNIAADYNTKRFERTIALLERGVFDMRPLITHRYAATEAQRAMEESTQRKGEFIKGVLIFED